MMAGETVTKKGKKKGKRSKHRDADDDEENRKKWVTIPLTDHECSALNINLRSGHEP